LPPINKQVNRNVLRLGTKLKEQKEDQKTRLAVARIFEALRRHKASPTERELTEQLERELTELLQQAFLLIGPAEELAKIRKLLDAERLRSADAALPASMWRRGNVIRFFMGRVLRETGRQVKSVMKHQITRRPRRGLRRFCVTRCFWRRTFKTKV